MQHSKLLEVTTSASLTIPRSNSEPEQAPVEQPKIEKSKEFEKEEHVIIAKPKEHHNVPPHKDEKAKPESKHVAKVEHHVQAQALTREEKPTISEKPHFSTEHKNVKQGIQHVVKVEHHAKPHMETTSQQEKPHLPLNTPISTEETQLPTLLPMEAKAPISKEEKAIEEPKTVEKQPATQKISQAAEEEKQVVYQEEHVPTPVPVAIVTHSSNN